jgi:hypothetical protein
MLLRLPVIWIVVVAVLPAFGAQADFNPDSVHIFDQGHVNWSQGWIEAVGTAAPSSTGLQDNETKQQQALTRAIVYARQHLTRLLFEIPVTPNQTIGQQAQINPVIAEKLAQMVTQTRVSRQEYLSDGTVKVSLRLAFSGGLAQLVLPGDIKSLEAIRALNSSSAEPSVPNKPPRNHRNAANIFTGLIVDARGLPMQPALYLPIYDEAGTAVYGSAFISRDFAVQYGTCKYTTDLDSALSDERIGENPLVVKGLHKQHTGGDGLIISYTDAIKLRSAPEHLAFLKSCRVIIVVDPPG